MAVEQLDALIAANDVVFLLTDTRERRVSRHEHPVPAVLSWSLAHLNQSTPTFLVPDA
jgi:hypothetical protein